MTIDLAVMRKRLEEKQAEIQQHIATLSGSPAQPEDAIQASDGEVEPEEEAVDLEETDVEQAILDNEKTLLVEVQQALARIENGTYGGAAIAGSQSPKNGWRLFPGPPCAWHASRSWHLWDEQGLGVEQVPPKMLPDECSGSASEHLKWKNQHVHCLTKSVMSRIFVRQCDIKMHCC